MPFEKLYIELTDACNLNCEMCYRHTWSHPDGHMHRDVLIKILDELKDNKSVKEIILGGIGEPTMHPDFKWLLPNLSPLEVTLTSNGTTIDDEMAELLVKYTHKLVVSVDGSQLVYDRIRGFEYDRLIQNIHTLNEAKQRLQMNTPQLMIQMVISDENKDDVVSVIKAASDMKASTLILSNLLPMTMVDAEGILYTQNDNSIMRSFYNSLRPLALRHGLELRLTETKLKTDRFCRFIESNAMVINSLGEIVPCYRFAHMGEEIVFNRHKKIEKVYYGRVGEKSLLEFWQSLAYKNFRNMVKGNRYPSCPDCDLVDGCDFVRSASADCYGNTPSCADCLWARNIIFCV